MLLPLTEPIPFLQNSNQTIKKRNKFKENTVILYILFYKTLIDNPFVYDKSFVQINNKQPFVSGFQLKKSTDLSMIAMIVENENDVNFLQLLS